MRKPTPSLNALRAFVAAGRHGNLKDAAGELFVTPSALSHQIRNLEESLDVQLFNRSKAGLSLTQAGELFYADMATAFEQIGQAVARLHQKRQQELLNVSMLSTFAMRWFIPRLAGFQRRHPEIEVRISTSVSQVDFVREDMDCAIRSGRGNWPGLHAVYLFAEAFTPVCSPVLAASLNHPEDLKNHTLLHARLRPDDWHVWLGAVGAGDIQPQHEQMFETRNFAIQAAVDGVGVAIVDPSLVAEEIRAGRLVVPFPQTLADESAYYLVYPKEHASLPRIRTFRKWLLEQTGSQNASA
ncbi:MAG: transcriptional regulator GcvA [Mariprofundaceae bacterium]|nr:transcriptional regulator GcvA [Mariprofundaceae bacterium]